MQGDWAMSSDRERERLVRLREKQLRDRDPGASVKVKWKDESAFKKNESLWKEIFGVLPGKVQGAIVGGLFGIVISIVAGLVIPDPFGWVCGSVAFLVAIGMGMVVGNATDHGSQMD
jgi:hypothetical protein